jgi:hypothetical protein
VDRAGIVAPAAADPEAAVVREAVAQARESRSRELPVLTHVVLFRPKPELTADAAGALIAAIERAAREIPVVRRFEIGPRTVSPPAYPAAAPPDFPYVAIVTLDDRAALDAYLAHPAHQALGAAFNTALGAALVYDYDTEDVAAGGTLRLTGST